MRIIHTIKAVESENGDQFLQAVFVKHPFGRIVGIGTCQNPLRIELFPPGESSMTSRKARNFGRLSGRIEVLLHTVHFRYNLRYLGTDGKAHKLKMTEHLKRCLFQEAKSRAVSCIREGCPEGELNCLYVFDSSDQPRHYAEQDMEIRGWWWIDKEKEPTREAITTD